MDLSCHERPSDSPFVERIWHNHTEREGTFTSMAETHWEMVVTRHQGKMTMTVRGPETQATPAYCPPDAEFFGIMFKPGTLMPLLPAQTIMNRKDVNLPGASSNAFWLNGKAWEFPNPENADTFVEHLVRDGLVIHDPVVSSVLQGNAVEMSLRTVQRRFLTATGLTYGSIFQIERARRATVLLKQGVPILDVVELAGYSDQPHMTRSLKHFVGQTPAQIISRNRTNPLSLLFNSTPF